MTAARQSRPLFNGIPKERAVASTTRDTKRAPLSPRAGKESHVRRDFKLKPLNAGCDDGQGETPRAREARTTRRYDGHVVPRTYDVKLRSA